MSDVLQSIPIVFGDGIKDEVVLEECPWDHRYVMLIVPKNMKPHHGGKLVLPKELFVNGGRPNG